MVVKNLLNNINVMKIFFDIYIENIFLLNTNHLNTGSSWKYSLGEWT